jgi:hypothetical protein
MDDITALRGDEEGTSHDVRGICSNKRYHFLTILDNVLTVGESAGIEEKAVEPYPHLGGLLEEVGGGVRNSMAADFAKALWRQYECCKKYVAIGGMHGRKNLEVQVVLPSTVFLLSALSGL